MGRCHERMEEVWGLMQKGEGEKKGMAESCQ